MKFKSGQSSPIQIICYKNIYICLILSPRTNCAQAVSEKQPCLKQLCLKNNQITNSKAQEFSFVDHRIYYLHLAQLCCVSFSYLPYTQHSHCLLLALKLCIASGFLLNFNIYFFLSFQLWIDSNWEQCGKGIK